jgi:hypothetical protein
LRAPLCAGFVFGADNTNACPPGFSKIGTAAVCASAAAAAGSPSVSSVTYADRPSGCSYAAGSVYFNDHPTGAPNPAYKPLCAGAPLPKPPQNCTVAACVHACARVCVRLHAGVRVRVRVRE